MSLRPLPGIEALAPYVPGLSIAEIRNKYGLSKIIKMASNENPLGVSPLAAEAAARACASAFRYPQGGNPRLAMALAKKHGVKPEQIVIGNGSDEIIDLLIRILAQPRLHNVACFNPCFSIYPIQAAINNIEVRRPPLKQDFSFDFPALLEAMDSATRLVFITTPDNPSGHCPDPAEVLDFIKKATQKSPDALIVLDEAYMDFADDEASTSLSGGKIFPPSTAFLRTFSKSYGLAGLRLGYAILPENLAEYFWRARLPFSVNLVAEEAGLAALEDSAFHHATLQTVREGRQILKKGLEALGCKVWPSQANFLLFQPPAGRISANDLHQKLLEAGVIIRALNSYNLPDHLRVSVGNPSENAIFLKTVQKILESAP